MMTMKLFTRECYAFNSFEDETDFKEVIIEFYLSAFNSFEDETRVSGLRCW